MEILFTSVIAFISTNLDDVFLLMIFYSQRRFTHRSIVGGQYLGITILIAISLAGSLVGLIVDKSYVGLLGLFPIYLGVRGIWDRFKKTPDEEDADSGPSAMRGACVAIALVTVANGGDNIGIYIPLFAALTWINKITMITIFLIMTAGWCILARYLAAHRYVATIIERYGHLIVPFVLIGLGIFILYESKTFNMLVGLFG